MDAQKPRIFERIVWLNVIVAAAALGLTWTSYALLAIQVHIPLLVLATAATFAVYTLDRIGPWSPEDAINAPRRTHWLNRTRWVHYCIGGIATLICLACLLFLSLPTITMIVALAVMTLAYVAPFTSKGSRLKDRRLFKSLFIALAWAGGAVVIPIVEATARGHVEISSVLPFGALLTGSHLLMVWGAALMFDLRDSEGDQSHQGSITSVFAADRLVRFVRILYIVAASGLGLAVTVGWVTPYWLAVFVMLVTQFALTFHHAPQPDTPSSTIYYGVLIDGSLGLSGLILLLVKHLP